MSTSHAIPELQGVDDQGHDPVFRGNGVWSSSEFGSESVVSARCQVLQNPVILETIFKKLDTPTLKSIRLVSSLWGNIASTPLGLSTIVGIFNLLPCCTENPTQPEINKKLIRNLWLTVNCYCPPEDTSARRYYINNEYMIGKPSPSMYKNFFPFTSQLNTTLVEISIDAVPFHFLKTCFIQMFATKKFQCLKKLQIRYITGLNDEIECSLPATIPQLQELRTLTDFFVDLMCWRFKCRNQNNMGGQILQPIVQAFINSSPNLRRLRIMGFNIYPELLRCTKLEEFVYYGVAWVNSSVGGSTPGLGPNTFCPTFNPMGVARMCAQVGKTLIRLILQEHNLASYSRAYNNPLAHEFRLPPMKKLTSLTIYPYYYPMTKYWFNKPRFPALKRLGLKSYTAETACNMFNSFNFTHDGIQELDVDFDLNPQLVPLISPVLPNLKRMSFGLFSYCNSPRGEGLLFKTMNSINLAWNLTQSDIRTGWIESASELVTFLEGVARLTGNKNLTIKHSDIAEDETDNLSQYSDRIKSALSSYSELKIHMSEMPWDNFATMSKDSSNLKLIFVDYEPLNNHET